ncbi:MAG: hypothetical protein CVU12_09745 [Bacteroidetes bacterium HGW-Bacteroidetes-7]|jgi:hypothetical protein|nr:MAG: hypothetical protein CVU12_09745 [Bacteroidetes bacterium HGW-Bacteroidetes-7]
MEINNLITIVTEKISSLPTKNKDAKIRLIEEIIKYSNYWQKYAEEEFREEKAEVRTALINLYKQSDMKDLIKMDEIISHLLLNQCCLFLSKIDFIGTISSGDTPLSKSQMGIFYFVKTGDIGKLILTYVIDKNGKTELKSLEALKKWEKEIDVNNNLTHALAINEDLSITFLGQFDKLFEDGISSYNESFIMAENRGMHPYTKIKANLDIGESIPKNMSLLKRYLTPNQHLEFRIYNKGIFKRNYFLSN